MIWALVPTKWLAPAVSRILRLIKYKFLVLIFTSPTYIVSSIHIYYHNKIAPFADPKTGAAPDYAERKPTRSDG